jgi:peptidyl-prolyl cis-trans isomerase SurA
MWSNSKQDAGKLLVLLGLLLAVVLPGPAHAQKTVDRILAVVDEHVILHSEVQSQYQFMKASGKEDDGTLWCRVMENMLTNKLLLSKAQLDSIEISEDRVDQELNRRINHMMQQYGGQQKLEEQLGQSVVELRVELRPRIREQLKIEREKQKIFKDIDVTPTEVRKYYKQIPEDSLPYLPAEVQLSKIVMKPEPSEQNKQRARQKLNNILNKIKIGEATFKEMARRHSQDRASRDKGGFMGEMRRGNMPSEFAEAVFNTGEGKLTDIFRTDKGYHIARVHKRLADKARVSHILIRPNIDDSDRQRTKDRLLEIRQKIKNGEMAFAEAARRYSDDPSTKDNGGRVMDQKSGSYRIPLDQLDANLYLQIDQMEEGDISKPKEFIFNDGTLSKAYQIIWLKKRYPPHQATLKTDYEKFHKAAKEAKRAEALKDWFKSAKDQVYIEIKDHRCDQALSNWLTAE